ELAAKRLELLRELLPTAARVAVLVNPANAATTEATLREVEPAARTMGLQIQVFNATLAERSMPLSKVWFPLFAAPAQVSNWHMPTRSDVRDYGEYWRISGPSAKCSGHFVRGVPRQLDLNRYGAERPRRAVASGLRTPAWRRARQSSPLASRRRTPDG